MAECADSSRRPDSHSFPHVLILSFLLSTRSYVDRTTTSERLDQVDVLYPSGLIAHTDDLKSRWNVNGGDYVSIYDSLLILLKAERCGAPGNFTPVTKTCSNISR